MSYILDALKKADTDRAREAAAVPDLYAQADAVRGARAAARTPNWVLLAIAAGAIALAALAWRWFGAMPDDELPPTPVTQSPLPAQLPTPAPAPVPPPAAAVSPAPAPVPPAPAPSTVQTPAPAPATVPARVPVLAPPPKPERQTEVAPATAVKPAAPASAAAEMRLLTLAELPPDVRSKLPALVVGGSMYSPNAKSRMVILNGQVFREGDKPVDGLSVEEIRLKSTVLAYRGLRFELKH